MFESTHHYRAVKAAAERYGNAAVAAEADIGLRANRIAGAIRKDTVGKPPLPPDVTRALRDMLPVDGAA